MDILLGNLIKYFLDHKIENRQGASRFTEGLTDTELSDSSRLKTTPPLSYLTRRYEVTGNTTFHIPCTQALDIVV